MLDDCCTTVTRLFTERKLGLITAKTSPSKSRAVKDFIWLSSPLPLFKIVFSAVPSAAP